MEATVCWKCKESSNPASIFHCVRCDNVEHIYCNGNYGRGMTCRFCSSCLDIKPHDPQPLPEWALNVATIDFAATCNLNNNQFCPYCTVRFCGQRCPLEEIHDQNQRTIQVRKRQDLCWVVKENEIRSLMSVDAVQTSHRDPDNERWVLLHPMEEHDECEEFVMSVTNVMYREFCALKCLFDQRQPVDPVNRITLQQLILKDFSHRPSGFCIDCRSTYCYSSDHNGHRVLAVVVRNGQYFLSMPHDIAANLGDLHCSEVLDDEADHILLPMTRPQVPKRCPCGNPVGEDQWFCCFPCKARFK